MFRSALIVVLAAVLGSTFGLLSWTAVVSISHPDSNLVMLGPLLAGTLLFTLPGAAFLLGVHQIARARAFSARTQAVLILASGMSAGAAVLLPVAILMADPPMWLDLALGAWFGFWTAGAFVTLSSIFRTLHNIPR